MGCTLSTIACGGPLLDTSRAATTSDRSKKAVVTADMVSHLVSIGFVGAATIILFSVASVSLLGPGKEPLAGCRIGDDVLRYTNGNAAPIPAQTDPLTLELAKILPASLPQGASISEAPEVRGAKPGFELPSPDHDASTTISEARDAVLRGGALITKTPSIEVSGSEQAATERLPIADEVNATPDASRGTEPTEIPNERLDQISGNVQIQQNQPAKLDQDYAASEENARAQKVQDQRVSRHLLSPNAAFRYRVQKECGPIIFPALHRHCVASFGVH
jgi:hypothetical protein